MGHDSLTILETADRSSPSVRQEIVNSVERGAAGRSLKESRRWAAAERGPERKGGVGRHLATCGHALLGWLLARFRAIAETALASC